MTANKRSRCSAGDHAKLSPICSLGSTRPLPRLKPADLASTRSIPRPPERATRSDERREPMRPLHDAYGVFVSVRNPELARLPTRVDPISDLEHAAETDAQPYVRPHVRVKASAHAVSRCDVTSFWSTQLIL